MWKQFSTDTSAEEEGVWQDFPGFSVLLARAGGKNRAWKKTMNKMAKPLSRRAGSVSMEELEQVDSAVFIKECIRNWKTKVDGKLKVGIEPPPAESGLLEQVEGALTDDGLMQVTENNIRLTLDAMPDLKNALLSIANDMSQYQLERREEVAGNSEPS